MKLPKRVIIIGGTHGNESTGIAIVQHYQEFIKGKFPTLNIEFVIGNPEAIKFSRRFVDEDLNRASQFLNEKRASFENSRARQIKELISQSPCFVIDLHTTTSNMGETMIISQDFPENFLICGLIQKKQPETKILFAPDPEKKYLISQSDFGVMIEVGPIAQGVLDPKMMKLSLNLLLETLAAINEFKPQKISLEYFEEVQDVHYPRNDKNEINAYIHAELQGQDYIKKPRIFKAFKSFEGADIIHEGNEELYPIFINEAAYYPAKLAFSLCRKLLRNL